MKGQAPKRIDCSKMGWQIAQVVRAIEVRPGSASEAAAHRMLAPQKPAARFVLRRQQIRLACEKGWESRFWGDYFPAWCRAHGVPLQARLSAEAWDLLSGAAAKEFMTTSDDFLGAKYREWGIPREGRPSASATR